LHFNAHVCSEITEETICAAINVIAGDDAIATFEH
jgi:hypothetical protein